ncbi:MAG TPA: penicillin-binding protein 2 [Vitreimonas sp.]|uniref:penicillin-binding protein 2 n=1 Tax=Vitreimonas sp. TaxID=3069702 RepID=UPI002D25C5A9|nr:penicillin-binding protein 2 [Vitreimonas sp.]HYD89335.1 penicillin-binding protein 2 [Vitreimonas sp.]
MKGKRVGSTLPKRDANVIFNRRAALLSFAGAGVLGAILFRMGQLQATNAFTEEYSNAADENRFDTRIVPPPRGVIYDRFGTILAQTSKDYQVAVLRAEVEDLEGIVGRVAQILGHDAEWARRAAIKVRGGQRYEPVPIKEGLTWEEFNAINVRLPELRGVVAQPVDVRAYPYDVVYGHPIGYVQKPTQRDIDRALENPEEGEARAVYLRNPHVRVGKAGLEASMEGVLHGEAGWRKVIVNARGVEQGEDESERREPKRGSGLVLTLDHELQRTAMQNFGEQSGSAVVMDIHTGDLLVMASAPGFDPNLFVNGIGQADFDAYNLNERKPLYHKSVTGVYPPGSTFKMIVGIAAKQAGLEDNWRTSCGGGFYYGGRTWHCWSRHGSVDLHGAIKHSCDVYFYQAALRAGPERIAAVARQFGLGQHFDINVPNIRDGLIPDPTWWRANRNEGWTGGLTVNYGIGQGAMGVTPLQLAVMAARLGNNGYAVNPRLVREAPGVGEPPRPPHMSGIESEHLARVRDGMYGVCNEPGGTANSAGRLELVRHPETGAATPATPETRGWQPVQIAGKTGTAQVRALGGNRGRHYSTIEWKYRDHALFCCFGPWHEPRYACAVIVEHGGAGSSVAGPIAREIMKATLVRDPSQRAPAQLAQLEQNMGRSA